MSVGLSDNPPGAAEGFVHRHPCAEAFVVYEGRGIYTVGDAVILAEAGDVVVVPRNTWHSFRPDGDARLRHVGVLEIAGRPRRQRQTRTVPERGPPPSRAGGSRLLRVCARARRLAESQTSRSPESLTASD